MFSPWVEDTKGPSPTLQNWLWRFEGKVAFPGPFWPYELSTCLHETSNLLLTYTSISKRHTYPFLEGCTLNWWSQGKGSIRREPFWKTPSARARGKPNTYTRSSEPFL